MEVFHLRSADQLVSTAWAFRNVHNPSGQFLQLRQADFSPNLALRSVWVEADVIFWAGLANGHFDVFEKDV